eukprot:10529341-Alexandrium_andersonii.AAC.1
MCIRDRSSRQQRGFSLNLQERVNFLAEAAKPTVMELARRARGWAKAQETASVQKADAATTGTGAGLGRARTMAFRDILQQ